MPNWNDLNPSGEFSWNPMKAVPTKEEKKAALGRALERCEVESAIHKIIRVPVPAGLFPFVNVVGNEVIVEFRDSPWKIEKPAALDDEESAPGFYHDPALGWIEY